TNLDVEIIKLFGFYSEPTRDPRHHTVTAVYLCKAIGEPLGGDDAKQAKIFKLHQIPKNLVFDHNKVIDDYLAYKKKSEKKNNR
ncbi:MAG TPA: NUDIX hydrolase, partial [bacterium]|nr:NUDIX hydrolase [bacterium]